MPCEDDESIVLRWTDQKQVFARIMSTLRQKEVFADVTLYCGSRRYAVHKFILSTCSPYLEMMLREAEGEAVTLVLADTTPEAVEALLDFMYLGQVDLMPEHLDPLLDLAHDLRIRGLITPSYDLHAEEVREAMRREREEKKKNEESRKMEEERRKAEEAGTRDKKETEERERKEKEEEMKMKKEEEMIREVEEREANEKRASLRRRRESSELRQIRIKEESKKNKKDHIENEYEDGIKKERTHGSSAIDENGETDIKDVPVRQAGSCETDTRQKENDRNEEIEMNVKRSWEQNALLQLQKNLKCKRCPETFGTFHELDMHLMSHIEKNLLSCPECPFRTLKREVLQSHLSKHISSKPYVCPYCQVRHTLEKRHITHQRTVHPTQPVVIRMAELKVAETSKCKTPPTDPVRLGKRKTPPLDLIKPSKVVIRDIAVCQNKKLYNPSPSPTQNVLNSPNSSSPSSPSSGLYQFSITSPSTSPIPTRCHPQPSHPEPSPSPPSTSGSQPSPSGQSYLPATPPLAASPPPLPRMQPCYVQLIRESSPSALSSESDSKSYSRNSRSVKDRKVKKLSKTTSKPRSSSKSHTESPAPQEKLVRGKNSTSKSLSSSEDPLRANTSSPCPSIISLSSEQSQTPSPQPVQRKKVKKDQSSVNRVKNVVQHSREK